MGVQKAFCDGVCMEHFVLSVIRESTVIAKELKILTAPLHVHVLLFSKLVKFFFA